LFFFSSRRRHTSFSRDWSSDVCSSDLLAQHQQLSQERAARAELLAYQLKELNEFNPLPGEFEQIDEEYKRLANSGQLLSTSQQEIGRASCRESVRTAGSGAGVNSSIVM